MKKSCTQIIAVDKDFKYTLLIKRTNDPGKGLLSGVGGHLDDKESPEDCAKREWEEEVGSSLLSNLIYLCTIETPEYTNYMYGVIVDKIDPYFSIMTDEGPISWYHIIGWHILDVNNKELAWNGVIPYLINVLEENKDNVTGQVKDEKIIVSESGLFNLIKELQLDIDGENVAIAQYESHIEQIEDVNIKAILTEITNDEKDHREKLTALLTELDPKLPVVSVRDDKWITTTPEKGDGKHILLDDNGNIIGGSVPKSAHGMNIREWGKSVSKENRQEAKNTTNNSTQTTKRVPTDINSLLHKTFTIDKNSRGNTYYINGSIFNRNTPMADMKLAFIDLSREVEKTDTDIFIEHFSSLFDKKMPREKKEQLTTFLKDIGFTLIGDNTLIRNTKAMINKKVVNELLDENEKLAQASLSEDREESKKAIKEDQEKQSKIDAANPRGEQISSIRNKIQKITVGKWSQHEKSMAIGQIISKEIDDRASNNTELTKTMDEYEKLLTKASHSMPTDEMTDRMDELADKLFKESNKVNVTIQQHISSIISELYGEDEIGGRVLTKKGSNIKFCGLLKDQSEIFQRGWVDALNTKYPSGIKVGKSARGYFSAGLGELMLSGRDDSKIKEIVTHELAHAFEHTVPGLRESAISFLNSRIKEEKPVSLRKLTGLSYDAEEIAVPDNFTSPYMGKIYEHGATEILSMGFEGVLYNKYRLKEKDPTYYNYILGTIISGGRK